VICYIGIGSNLDNRRKNILRAIGLLKKDKNIKLIKKSRLYETNPLAGPAQGKYLNAVLKIETVYSPHTLLDKFKAIESALGRRSSSIKWSARTIDLDILFYGKRIIKSKKLTIPHPEIKNRIFVLKPLTEIAPGLIHPVFRKTAKRLLKEYCIPHKK
jgi:2-amino-4-hydroxy-6-hydroxymethyldihydropteridine diphosphokinase